MRGWWLGLVLGCASTATGPEEGRRGGPVLTLPQPVPASPRDEAWPVHSFALWQGWAMRWSYNHRLSRTGALVEQFPCVLEEAECRARLTVAAASGSGPDTAELETRVMLVAARGVAATSAAKEFVLRGREGQTLEQTGTLRLPWPEGVPPGERSWHAVLSGLDFGSLGSADKLRRLGVQLGPVRAEGRELEVPVTVRTVLDCRSGECPPMDRVDVSILVGVMVLGGEPGALQVRPHRVRLDYGWAKRESLPSARTSTQVAPSTGGLGPQLGQTGFDVALDEEMHVLDFGLLLDSSEARVDAEVRTWSPGMRRRTPPYSLFAYAQGGRAEWTVDVLDLNMPGATSAGHTWSTQLGWRPRGRDAFDSTAQEQKWITWGVR